MAARGTGRPPKSSLPASSEVLWKRSQQRAPRKARCQESSPRSWQEPRRHAALPKNNKLQCKIPCHRSHFGSRYKLGCCGHAGLFAKASSPAKQYKLLSGPHTIPTGDYQRSRKYPARPTPYPTQKPLGFHAEVSALLAEFLVVMESSTGTPQLSDSHTEAMGIRREMQALSSNPLCSARRDRLRER